MSHLGMYWKGSPALAHPAPACKWDLFFPIYQPPDYCPQAKGTGSHHFFQAVKPEKILLKGPTEALLGVWKTPQNRQQTF